MSVSDTVEALLAQGRFDEAVCTFVTARQQVSFLELERLLAPYMEVKGDWTYGPTDYPGILWWFGMSEAFSDLTQRLLESHRLFLHGADMLTYMIDGGIPSMPLVKRVQAYAKPHWCPCVFCSYPLPPEKPKSKAAPRIAARNKKPRKAP